MVTSTIKKYKVGDLVIAPLGFMRIPAAIVSIYFKGKLCKVTYMHPNYGNDATALIDSLEPLC